MSSSKVAYLVFDIESVPDPALVSLVRTGGAQDPTEALCEYQAELLEKKGSEFVPYAYHVPVSIAIAKVGEDFSLIDLIVLKIDQLGQKKMCESFWKGWKAYNYPQFVTFNGRGFDIPLMELTAFRHGLDLREWFNTKVPSYQQPRNRYANSHLDLYDFLTNYGATQIVGGLNLISKMLRKSGKIGTKGDMVQELLENGQLDEIHSYCRCDVLDTYFVFLRSAVLRGLITSEYESELIERTRKFLEDNIDKEPVYGVYLDAWQKVSDFLKEHDEIEQLVALSGSDDEE